jgi:protein-L-isoaspartate(D-aspartate) O-methyltransferase
MKYPKSGADLMLFRSAPVHAVDQRRQLRRGQRQRLSRFDARRPQKDAVLEPFGEQAESGSIPIGGRVYAYEIEERLAARAREHLRDAHQVELRTQSGVTADLPLADLIYVCAGAAQPSRTWLDALRPKGRLLFPLAPQGVLGGMLLITRPDQGSAWPAKFVGRAAFIGCVGLQDEEPGRRLTEAFSKVWHSVRSLRLDGSPDDSCWFAGDGWWLSTADA